MREIWKIINISNVDLTLDSQDISPGGSFEVKGVIGIAKYADSESVLELLLNESIVIEQYVDGVLFNIFDSIKNKITPARLIDIEYGSDSGNSSTNGTDSNTFRIGLSGPKIKNISGSLSVRNFADSVYVDFIANNFIGNGSQLIGLTKSQVGLGNVLNIASYSKSESDSQLTAKSNQSTTYTKTEVDTISNGKLAANGNGSGLTGLTKAQVGLGNVANVDATARVNHTGLQAISTITNLQTNLDAKLNLSGGTITGGLTVNSLSINGGDITGVNQIFDPDGATIYKWEGGDNFLYGQFHGDGSGLSGLTKTQVGLSNVPNVDATNRTNHTGSQAISTVTNLQTSLDAKLGTTGNGSGLTALNASNIATGTLSASRLPSLPYLPTAGGTMAADAIVNVNNTFQLYDNTVDIVVLNYMRSNGTIYCEPVLQSVGGFTGNGTNITSLNANNIISGTISAARLPTTVTLAQINSSNLTVNAGNLSLVSGNDLNVDSASDSALHLNPSGGPVYVGGQLVLSSALNAGGQAIANVSSITDTNGDPYFSGGGTVNHATTADVANISIATACLKIQNPIVFESFVLRSPALMMYFKYKETTGNAIDYGPYGVTGTYHNSMFGNVIARNAWRFRFGGSGFTKTAQNGEGVRLHKPNGLSVFTNKVGGPTPVSFTTVFRYLGGGNDNQYMIESIGFTAANLFLDDTTIYIQYNGITVASSPLSVVDILPHLLTVVVSPASNGGNGNARLKVMVDGVLLIDIDNVSGSGSNQNNTISGIGCWAGADYGTWPGSFSDMWANLRAVSFEEHMSFYREMLREIQFAG